MYSKAKLFDDEKICESIMKTNDCKIIKSLGRIVSNYDEDIWAAARFQIVVSGNHHKFCDPKLKKKLLDTGDAILAEGAAYDKIWGIGLDANDPDALIVKRWCGLNLLGKALMEVRDRFKAEKLKLK